MTAGKVDGDTVLSNARPRRRVWYAPQGRTDLINPICILLLGLTGVCFIYSAGKFVDAGLWSKQLIFLGLGGVVYTGLALIDYKYWLQYGLIIYLGALFLLLLLWTPLGLEAEGSRRWLRFPVLNFQPSETAKFGSLILVSSLLARSELGTLRASLWVLAKVFVVSAIPFILIFLQPDLGSALVFGPMIFSLLYVSRLSQRFFIVVLCAFLSVLAIIGTDIFRYYQFLESERANGHEAHEVMGEFEDHSWLPLHDYQRNRILGFVAPEAVDPRGIGISWNYLQSIQAVGTGGPFGKGWTQGDQAQLGYLPRSVAHNDFIFAVLAEEMGFAGATFVVGVFFVLLFNSLRIATMARDRFGMLLAVGVTVIFMVHVFINIGMTIGLMPITGLPLPFMSYGGSFILSCCMLQGLVQSVYRHRRNFA